MDHTDLLPVTSLSPTSCFITAPNSSRYLLQTHRPHMPEKKQVDCPQAFSSICLPRFNTPPSFPDLQKNNNGSLPCPPTPISYGSHQSFPSNLPPLTCYIVLDSNAILHPLLKPRAAQPRTSILKSDLHLSVAPEIQSPQAHSQLCSKKPGMVTLSFMTLPPKCHKHILL